MEIKKTEKPSSLKGQSADNSKRSARRPGRPTGVAKGAERRQLLLETALAMFARQGIADTPLTAIAREAGVTPAMLHYYFNTREQLLDVLIEERFLPIRSSFINLFQNSDQEPVAALTLLAKQFIDISIAHEWFAPLWIREIISESGMLKARMDQRHGSAQRDESIRNLVRWQKEGKLNAGLDPELIFISLFGLTFLPIASSRMPKSSTDRHLDSEQLARHVVALLLNGLSPAHG